MTGQFIVHGRSNDGLGGNKAFRTMSIMYQMPAERTALVLRAGDGSLLEIFEWVSEAAIESAHANPAVHALWERYAACCDYITLGDLAEAKTMFPSFTLVGG